MAVSLLKEPLWLDLKGHPKETGTPFGGPESPLSWTSGHSESFLAKEKLSSLIPIRQLLMGSWVPARIKLGESEKKN